jgi:phosphopantetheinyl transferase
VLLAISTIFMSPAVLPKYGAQDDAAARLAYFFDVWTAKEAYIKAVGGPVRFSPESITVQAEPRLNIWHDTLAGNFRLALVWMDRRDNAGGPC